MRRLVQAFKKPVATDRGGTAQSTTRNIKLSGGGGVQAIIPKVCTHPHPSGALVVYTKTPIYTFMWGLELSTSLQETSVAASKQLRCLGVGEDLQPALRSGRV